MSNIVVKDAFRMKHDTVVLLIDGWDKHSFSKGDIISVDETEHAITGLTQDAKSDTLSIWIECSDLGYKALVGGILSIKTPVSISKKSRKAS